MEKNKVIVKIRNKEYIIMSSDSQEYILSVANELDKRISELSATNSALHPERLIILASLNLCDEYMKLKDTNKALQQQITNCSNEINRYHSSTDVAFMGDAELLTKLEKANEQAKLLESRLSDDGSLISQIESLKKQISEFEIEKSDIKKSYEEQIKSLKEEFSKKENEFLEMIDKL